MNQNLKRFFSITALVFSAAAIADDSGSCSTCPTSCATAQNLYQPHAFSASFSREIMLEKAAWFPMSDDEGWHGTFGVGFDYMHTFANCKATTADSTDTGCCTNLGSLPFWSSNNSNTMTVGGRTGSDLDAYQLGMGPVTTTGTVFLNPVIYQVGADFLLYIGAHKTERGFFFKVHAPVGVMNTNPNLGFTDTVEEVVYPVGSLAQASTTPAPYENIQAAFKGGQSAGYLQAMVKGLISSQRTSSAKFGDAEFALGYNLFADDKKHVGIAIRFSAPTGNKAEGIYVFEPIFGRNGHWGAGGEIIAHYKFWESDSSDDKWAQLFFDGDVMHLFTSKHMRSFDLANNGAGSKYMLLGQFIGNAIHTTSEFQNQVLNAVNITTVGVCSTFAAEGNFAIGADFHWKNWSLEIGYEGWGRTCEQLKLDCSCPGSTNFNNYAVLGRQTAYAIDGTTFLGLCEPAAKIGTSQEHANTFATTTTIKDACLSANRIPADANDALDIEGQRARSVYTSKPYAELRYTWTDSDYVPYLAVTGGAEIPNSHKNEAAKFWNIGLNGGIAF
jgi:hypothetical protein